jgi:hypothetical protein
MIYVDNTGVDEAMMSKKKLLPAGPVGFAPWGVNHKNGLILIGIVLALAPGGCGSKPDPVADRAREGALLFEGATDGSVQEAGRWSIALGVFAGADRAARARAYAERIRGEDSALAEAFVAERGSRAAVLLGRLSSPSSSEAQRLLDRVRGIRLDGGRPFATAFFLPPEGEPVRDDLDLRFARQNLGAEVTLQIGAYGRLDGAPSEKQLAEFRAQAEQAAEELRRQGELAFYFHGPSLSMVTVGAFRQDDLGRDPRPLAELQERFPHNLYNGQGIREKLLTLQGEQTRIQPSQVVAIP